MWLRADATPYYIGKGKDLRAFSNQHSVPPPAHHARILIQYWSSAQEAFDMEKFYIRLFGRKDNGTGILRNLTDGGEGQSIGYSPSSIARARMSASRLGVSKSPAHRSAIGAANKGNSRPDMKERFSISNPMCDPILRAKANASLSISMKSDGNPFFGKHHAFDVRLVIAHARQRCSVMQDFYYGG
jgi:hypothetical protein